MQTITIQIFWEPEEGYRFQILAPDERILLMGEPAPSKFIVLQSIAHLMAHAANDQMYAKRMSPDYQFQFAIKQRSGRQIGQSPLWKSRHERDLAIEQLRKLARNARLLDAS